MNVLEKLQRVLHLCVLILRNENFVDLRFMMIEGAAVLNSVRAAVPMIGTMYI